MRRISGAVAIALSLATPAGAEQGFDLAVDAAGTLFKATETGLARSNDLGRTWQTVPLPADFAASEIRVLAVPAGKTDALYVAGPVLGVAEVDAATGRARAIGTGLPKPGASALAAHATQPETLYAVVPSDGIWRSKDAGTTWERADRRNAEAHGLIHTNLKGSMQSGWLYAALPGRIRFSMDCFCLWRNAGAVPGTVTALEFDPSAPETMYAASSEGFFRSEDAGQTWVPVASPASEVAGIAVDRHGEVFVLAPGGDILRSADRGASWERVGA